MDHCLEVTALKLWLGESQILEEINFALRFGETLAIVGESGAGKSMVAQAIIQCLPDSAKLGKDSSIKLAGTELTNLTAAEMCHVRGHEIGLIFQDAMAALNPVQKIGPQLIETIVLHQKLHKDQAKAIILDLLTAVGMHEPHACYQAYPHQLSGGMLQRALIASVLAAKPKLIIADEPTTALDVTIQAKLMRLLAKIKHEYECGLIFISHDLMLVRDIADTVMVMQNGICVEYAKAAEFFAGPKTDYGKALLKAAQPEQALQAVKVQPKALEIVDLNVQFAKPKTYFWQKTEYFAAVKNVSLTLNAGTTLALIGESGSGKTSLAKALLGINAYTGQLNWADSINPKQDVSVVFQNPFASMNPRLKVQDILSEIWQANPKLKPNDAKELLEQALLEVGLPVAALKKYPHQFSGGERQRLCIARAIIARPKLIILDEPTSALDVSVQVKIAELLLALQAKYNYTYLLITHDFVVVKKLAHAVAVMQHGQIVEQGSVQSVFYQPQQAYTQKLLAAIPGADLVL